MRILLKYLVDELARDFHRAGFRALFNCKVPPVGQIERVVNAVRLGSLPELLLVLERDNGRHFVDDVAVFLEELVGSIRGEPILQRLEFLLVLLRLGQRDLVRVEGTFDNLAMDFLWAGPALNFQSVHTIPMSSQGFMTNLWCFENQNWPSRLGDWIAFPGSLLDLLDLCDRPNHRTMKIRINIVEVIHKARLVAISGKQCCQLSVIHAAVNGPLTDLESV